MTSKSTENRENGWDNVQRPPCNNKGRLKGKGQWELSYFPSQTPNLPAKPDMNRTKGNPLGNPLRYPKTSKEAQCDPDTSKIRTGDLQCHRSRSIQEYLEKQSGHNPQGSGPQPQTPRITPPPSFGCSRAKIDGIMPLEQQGRLRIPPRVITLTRVQSLCI